MPNQAVNGAFFSVIQERCKNVLLTKTEATSSFAVY